MDIELTYNDKIFKSNISPLMPIGYLRRIAFKSFNIPEYLIELSYNGIKIEKKYNETLLKDYFPNNLSVIYINVSEIETKNNFRSILNSTKSTSLRTLQISKLVQKEKDLIKKKYLHFNTLNENGGRIGKCNECNDNLIEYYCRENSKFICSICKKKRHKEHKFIEIEKGNIEQLGNLYKKILIDELKIEEENLRILIKKNKKNLLNKFIDELYNLINKIIEQEKKITDIYPSIPLKNISQSNIIQIKKNIYSIENNSKDPFNYEDKINYFKELQKEDFSIDSIRKDIESIEKKYHLKELLTQIIFSYYDKLKIFSEELEILWNEKRKNIFVLSSELEDIIESYKKNFNLDNYYSTKKPLFESKKINEIFHYKNKVLPRVKNSRNFPILKNFFNTNYSENQINLLSNDLDSSSESNYSLKGFNSLRNASSYKENYISNNFESDIKLDSILLTDKNIEQLNKPQKKDSIRMSIFIKNKMKMDNLTPVKLMKLKKKKKKIV